MILGKYSLILRFYTKEYISMDQQVTVFTLAISVATSFIGSFIFFWYIKNRERRIRSKIAELEYEEKFLDRIKKGNIELIRSSFKVLFISLFLTFSTATALFICYFVPAPELVTKAFSLIAICAWSLAAGVCLSYFRSLVRLNNLPLTKEKIHRIRTKLEGKL